MKMNNDGDGLVIGVILIILLIVVLLAFGIKSAWCDTYIIEGKVTKTWIDYSDEGSHYLIRLPGDKMLECQRNLIYSGDEYNPDIVFTDIEVNHTYKFTCWGWQVSWANIYWYPNVIIAEELH